MHSYVLMFLFICCISGPLLCLPLDVFPVQTFPMENEMITFARNLGVEADIMAICMEWFLLFFFFFGVLCALTVHSEACLYDTSAPVTESCNFPCIACSKHYTVLRDCKVMCLL